jgi:UDP-glucose 4-epimerase
MTRVLVIGSEGFIGKHLVPELDDDVVCVDEVRSGAATGADIRQPLDSLELPKGITACVHLAAVASPRIAQEDPARAWGVNVLGTHNVLKLCQRAGIRKVVFLSSAHVYGISPKYMPSDETHPLALHDTYTTTKILGEQLCELFYRNHGISYTTLRLFNGYGPGQSPDYFMGQKLKQSQTGKVTLRGSLVTKDWVYVDDVVDAIVRATKTEYVGPLNIGTGVETNLFTIAAQIARAYGATLDVLQDDNDPGPTRMCADNRRAKDVLGWSPRVALEEGLARTIEASR